MSKPLGVKGLSSKNKGNILVWCSSWVHVILYVKKILAWGNFVNILFWNPYTKGSTFSNVDSFRQLQCLYTFAQYCVQAGLSLVVTLWLSLVPLRSKYYSLFTMRWQMTDVFYKKISNLLYKPCIDVNAYHTCNLN